MYICANNKTKSMKFGTEIQILAVRYCVYLWQGIPLNDSFKIHLIHLSLRLVSLSRTVKKTEEENNITAMWKLDSLVGWI